MPMHDTRRSRTFRTAALCGCWTVALWTVRAEAQSVGLPAPRLLTTMPMGGAVGSTFDVAIGGDFLDGASRLVFSHPKITAVAKTTADGRPEPNRFVVSVAADCPPGLHEARVMTRLGLSSSRAFSVGTLPEVVQVSPNTTLATAQALPLNSVCNAACTARSVDHYTFEARRGMRILVDCAAKGIDSKSAPVVIVADAAGNDLQVERRGGALVFAPSADGRYVVKVHELTYQGGPAYFYRLVLRELAAEAPLVRHPATQPVNSFSWPPPGLPATATTVEQEPNNEPGRARRLSLPCDVAGSFFPAADVDLFEFDAVQGEEWWVEVASERFGLPTDPAVLVQHVAGSGQDEKTTDVAELSDIASPVKVSSNGYAYDGPPYNAGSSDVLGKLVIRTTGRHRLKLTDLFGGTRSDPRNTYRLVIRKAAPDFAVAAWALHMELRNGDRNALSKPIALRSGATMALEVVALRRDGFDGEIQLSMEGLPPGVRSTGLKIPAGKSRGILLVSADADAADAFATARFEGRGVVAGKETVRPCRLASMAWPVTDAWGEVPSPRLLADVPVSVTRAESAALSIAPASQAPLTATVGGKLTVPLKLVRRGEFSGGKTTLKVFGEGFEQAPAIDLPLSADQGSAVLDLASLKTPPGEYRIAFYGGVVTQYRYAPEAVKAAESARADAEKSVGTIERELKQLTEAVKKAPAEKKAEMDKACKAMEAKQKAAVAALNTAAEQARRVAAAAEPKGIVDIVVSEPISIRVLPAEKQP